MYLHTMHEKVNKLMSYGAILNFIIDNRDSGKSTQFKKRALMRAIKHGTMCVWLRRYKEEIIPCKAEFLNDKFFKVLEIDYPKKFKREDFKIKGNYAYYKNKRFVYFINVGKCKSDKGIDAENIDTFVFDEFMTNDKKYNYYRGNEVHDFFTIFFTKKRTHADGTTSQINCYLLGNRDSFTNPFYTYFDLPYLDLQFEGIKTFRNGSIAIMQLNTHVLKNETKYDKKLNALFKDTPFEKYLNGGTLSNETMRFYNRPKNAQFYAQFDFGYCLSIGIENGKFYVFTGLDKKRFVFTKKPNDKYKKNYVLKRGDNSLFKAIQRAYQLNNIRYDNAITHDTFIKILDYISML